MDDALGMYVSQASQQLPQDLHVPHLGLPQTALTCCMMDSRDLD